MKNEYKIFENIVKYSAEQWFCEKSYPICSKNRFCIDKNVSWKYNIILPEVAEYVDDEIQKRAENSSAFPLHKHVWSGKSSQAMIFNLIGPLIVRDHLEPIIDVFSSKGIPGSEEIISASFEYEDKEIFNEYKSPTSFDAAFYKKDGTPLIFVESKLTEQGFGSCSIRGRKNCDGLNPLRSDKVCHLKKAKRTYWEIIEKHGFDELIVKEEQCMFGEYYQFFREVLFTIEKNGIFVLLYDKRNPYFNCIFNGSNTFSAMEFVPRHFRDKIYGITVQDIAETIEKYSQHTDWIGEFKKKYAILN